MVEEPAPRGRPRDERSHAAIVTAAAELVAEVGYHATSVSAVAARAGVGKDTVYRRWSGKAGLVYEAVFTVTDNSPLPDTGSLEGDLRVLVQGLIDEFSAPAAAAALPGLLADFAADPALRDSIRGTFLRPARERLLELFARAEGRGETVAEVPDTLVLDALVGTVFFHLGIVGERPDRDLARRIAAITARGIEAR